MIRKSYCDLETMLHGVLNELLWAKKDSSCADLCASPSVFSFDNLLVAKSADMGNFDLADIGLTGARWSRFLRDYIDLPSLREWLPHAVGVDRGRVSGFLTKQVISSSRTGHRWGNCLYGVAFRNSGLPTLTLFSRMAHLTRGGAMDLTLASVLARYLAEGLDIQPRDIRVVWYVSGLFLSGIMVVPYLATINREEEFLQSESFIAKTTRWVFDRWIIPGDDSKYGPTKRVCDRYRQIKSGTAKHCFVRELVFPFSNPFTKEGS